MCNECFTILWDTVEDHSHALSSIVIQAQAIFQLDFRQLQIELYNDGVSGLERTLGVPALLAARSRELNRTPVETALILQELLDYYRLEVSRLTRGELGTPFPGYRNPEIGE